MLSLLLPPGSTLLVFCLCLGCFTLGYVLRWRHGRALFVEQHQVHELCEDASYLAGRDRGRSELGKDECDRWYKEGWADCEGHARAMGRRGAASTEQGHGGGDLAELERVNRRRSPVN